MKTRFPHPNCQLCKINLRYCSIVLNSLGLGTIGLRPKSSLSDVFIRIFANTNLCCLVLGSNPGLILDLLNYVNDDFKILNLFLKSTDVCQDGSPKIEEQVEKPYCA